MLSLFLPRFWYLISASVFATNYLNPNTPGRSRTSEFSKSTAFLKR
jgi:hypothetical protein